MDLLRIAARVAATGPLKLTYDNTSYAKSSGHWWVLRLKEMEVGGRTVSGRDVEADEMGDLERVLAESGAEYEYPYWSDDGPSSEHITICGQQFSTEDLKNEADTGKLIVVSP